MAKKKKVEQPQIDQGYIDEYLKNETDANRQMIFANLLGAAFLLIILVLYALRVFEFPDSSLLFVYIILPVDIAILVSPVFYLKSNRLSKPGFKYFVIFSFLLVMATLNILIPKHMVIGWAIVIIMTNHYYNPKLGLIVFIFIIISVLVCLYLGAFFGEYDPYLLSDGLVDGVVVYEMRDGLYVYPDTPVERYELLQRMLDLGFNRYVRIFTFYFIPRAMLLTVIFFVSNGLNVRTYKLLVNEIRVNSDKQKIGTELNVAKEIQLNTLPNEFITNEDVEILAELKAAKEVGGDFYDYFNLDDNHVAVVIGDVSGKGVPAAMFMMKTITCFKNFIAVNKSPSQILKEVNKTIYEGNTNQMFVTCFLAIINTKTGHVRFSNAGHNPPIIGDNFHYRYLKCNSGFILGGMENAFVKDEETYLKNGESLTLYTDGITEAKSEDEKFYGEERLINFFNSKDFSCILEMHHDLKDNVSGFVGKAEQSDDITFLTIKFHGDKYDYAESYFEAKKEKMPEMLDFCTAFNDKHNLGSSIKNNLLVVADELLSNIIKYSYENDEEGGIFIRLLYNIDKNELITTIIDTGKEFNPFDVSNTPLEGEAKDQRVGGLGILIVKNIMDEYAYDHINNKNIITLRKKL